MVWFTARKELEIAYFKWLDENKEVEDCPFNVISFLEIKGLLDEQKVKAFLESTKEMLNNDKG